VKNPVQIDKFGIHLKKLRNIKGWSQKQLADSTNLPKITIQRIELAKTSTTIDTMISIATALEIDLKTLVDF
jgi:transcriptional regulator with XRE-family HTH domain